MLQVRDDEGEDSLAFFAVENKEGLNDPTIRRLVAAIECTAKALPSMKVRVPPGWIAVYDQLCEMAKATPPRQHLPRSELLEIAGDCGLPHKPGTMGLEREVDLMLSFLHS